MREKGRGYISESDTYINPYPANVDDMASSYQC